MHRLADAACVYVCAGSRANLYINGTPPANILPVCISTSGGGCTSHRDSLCVEESMVLVLVKVGVAGETNFLLLLHIIVESEFKRLEPPNSLVAEDKKKTIWCLSLSK